MRFQLKNKLLKALPIIGFFVMIALFSSCRKEIPSGKMDYVGKWECVDGQSAIFIKSNGEATWEVVPGSGDQSITGKITFTSSGFYIKRFFHKKTLIVTQEPTPLTFTTGAPGDYTHVAIFNDKEYYKF